MSARSDGAGSSLSVIEEVSGESGAFSERGSSGHKKDSMIQKGFQVIISNFAIQFSERNYRTAIQTSPTFEEDEIFYDANEQGNTKNFK